MAVRRSIHLTTDVIVNVGRVPVLALPANPACSYRLLTVQLRTTPRSAAGAIGISLDGPKLFEDCAPMLVRWLSQSSQESADQMHRGAVWLVSNREDDETYPVLVQEGVQMDDPPGA